MRYYILVHDQSVRCAAISIINFDLFSYGRVIFSSSLLCKFPRQTYVLKSEKQVVENFHNSTEDIPKEYPNYIFACILLLICSEDP